MIPLLFCALIGIGVGSAISVAAFVVAMATFAGISFQIFMVVLLLFAVTAMVMGLVLFVFLARRLWKFLRSFNHHKEVSPPTTRGARCAMLEVASAAPSSRGVNQRPARELNVRVGFRFIVGFIFLVL